MKVYTVYPALDDMESSYNQKLTKRSVTFRYSVGCHQCCECDD